MSYKTIVGLFWLSAVALLFNPRTVQACSCVAKPTVLDQYDSAKNVVIAQVMSVEKADESLKYIDNIKTTKLTVERVFKGDLKPGDEMIFAQGGGGDCIWTFSEENVGKRFLFYLSSKSKDQSVWYAGICGRSRNLEYASDDLLYLENMAKARGKTRFSGSLYYDPGSAVEGVESIDRPVRGSKVRIIGEKKTVELLTNPDGVYEIYDLPAGVYVVEPEIPDGWKIEYTSGGPLRRDIAATSENKSNKPSYRVVLEPGKHAFFDFSYNVNNSVRGKVFDGAGNGMKGVCIDILPAEGKVARYFRKSDCTEGDGSFEIRGVPPGSYVLVVNKEGRISSREPFSTFYFPNVFEREKAAVIHIGLGQVISDINIYVPKMEDTVTVEGLVSYSDGKPAADQWIEFEARNPPNGMDGGSRAQTDSKGRFQMRILKGLQGSVFGEIYVYSGMYENCPKLEELIKNSSRIGEVKTNAVEIRADDNLTNLQMRFPFPNCKKAKRDDLR